MELQVSGGGLAWHTSAPLHKSCPLMLPAWHLTRLEGGGGSLSWEEQGEGHLLGRGWGGGWGGGGGGGGWWWWW